MRELQAGQNVIEIKDELAGVIHEFYYRLPTNKERVQYQAGLVRREGNKVINCALRQQLEFGAKILTGFKKGSISVGGQAIASDPDDPGYCESWKDVLCKGAPDLVQTVGRVVFDGIAPIRLPDNLKDLEFEVEEIDRPLTNTSSGD